MRAPELRDREAPGSNPGPPTNSGPLIIGGLALIAGIGADYSSTWAMNKLGIT